MITLPTNHPYFFTCPSCGCKLISVSTGNRAKPIAQSATTQPMMLLWSKTALRVRL